jgi:hypothetical protein
MKSTFSQKTLFPKREDTKNIPNFHHIRPFLHGFAAIACEGSGGFSCMLKKHVL